ncbi:MAG: hypothetical protein JRG71_01220 [Deltaproteobacteria bacterium]|nr:hypothetical protein [Deltaproteobacteria bacterium]
MSCKKAQKFFEQYTVEIEETVDPRKEPIDSETAWQKILGAKRIVVVKGKVLKDLLVTERNREEILASVIGPSGKLRAPTFKVGDYYVVGFNEEMYVTQLQE